MMQMARLPHLFPRNTGSAEGYTRPSSGPGNDFKLPRRSGRVSHGESLVRQVKAAEEQHAADISHLDEDSRPQGVTLEFTSDPEFELYLQSLERRRRGIELLNAHVIGDVMHAVVYVPQGKMGHFVSLFEAYTTRNTKPEGGIPKNKKLAESISSVRLAALKSFWTDVDLFPDDENLPLWWEVWLREDEKSSDVSKRFGDMVAASGIEVNPQQIYFSERRVLLARATIKQWATVSSCSTYWLNFV